MWANMGPGNGVENGYRDFPSGCLQQSLSGIFNLITIKIRVQNYSLFDGELTVRLQRSLHLL